MKKIISGLLILLAVSQLSAQTDKAPAYPLITHDPYFSIWSTSDSLAGAPTTHWTGTVQSLTGFIKTDGIVYRFMGKSSPRFATVVPASDETNYDADYTEEPPGNDWMTENYNAAKWKKGKAPFSDNDAGKGTSWKTKDIWIRRTFNLNTLPSEKLFLKIQHDDNAEVYLNGEQIYAHTGWLSRLNYIPLDEKLRSKLKKGKNVLALHVANTAGGAWADLGLAMQTIPNEKEVLLARQENIIVNATQTIYDFTAGKIKLKVTFTSPLLLNDLQLLSTPISYITAQVQSTDGADHKVQVYLGASTDIATNTPLEEVKADKYSAGKLAILKAGTKAQPVLQKKGDDVRIDWGYLYVATPAASRPVQYITKADEALSSFIANKFTSGASEGKSLSLNTVLSFDKTGSLPKEQVVLIGYDDLYSVQYFNQNLKAWWKEKGAKTFEEELSKAADNYQATIQKCTAFNKELHEKAVKAGGETYAQLCEIAYRQSIAAHKLLKSPGGDILFLSKENFSNGCINTVDLTYPSAPLFLAYNPDLMKGMMNGIFYYSESGKYTKPFAAHDLGTYPLANGQVYDEDMPVEESGNMLILAGAIAKAEGNASYAKKHWKTLSTWAGYLLKEGFDPANQLCT
ncbi:MAG: DUF4965 domain-containing protein, partial [Chitinophagaceae bacterium]|nr:DUF4965 domain-containing protein [Chitinophagaceae bacterium]